MQASFNIVDCSLYTNLTLGSQGFNRLKEKYIGKFVTLYLCSKVGHSDLFNFSPSLSF